MPSAVTSPASIIALKSGPLAKLDTSLVSLYLSQTPGAATSLGVSAETAGLLSPQADKALLVRGSDGAQSLVIDVTAQDGDGATLLHNLDAIGLQHGSAYGAVASGLIRVADLGALSNVADLGFASADVAITNVGAVTTQGDHAQHDDLARALGVDGTGVKIGILSNSFDTTSPPGPNGQPDDYARDVATGDLPAGVQIVQEFVEGADDEGRGMAQLVHDLAPGAQIAFATADYGQANFANNIVALAQTGAQILVDDAYYTDEPIFQNGVIAQAINYVASQGVTYFSSAGNEGTNGFTSTWHDSGTQLFGEELLDFGPGQNYLEVTASGGVDIVSVQWDQPYASAGGPGSQSDLDFFLTDQDGNVISVGGDDNIDHDPIERVGFQAPEGTVLRLYLGYYSGPIPGLVKVVDFADGGSLGTTSYNLSNSTLVGHPTAQGAIAVGATAYTSTPAYGVSPPQVEGFSSGGPTPTLFADDGTRLTDPAVHIGPAFTAADGGETTFFYGGTDPDQNGIPNFYGTSAAAPDAAATAALMLQARAELTSDDVRALLSDSAIDQDDPNTPGFDAGYDSATGAGFIQADQAVFFSRTLSISNAAAVELYGTHLGDAITAGAGDNTIFANGGDDTVDAGGGDDTVYAGDGNDVVTGGGGDDVVYGGIGNDQLFGNDGDDKLLGGTGNDTLRGNGGDDTLDGGDGIDTALYGGPAVHVDLALQGAPQDTLAGMDTLIGIENVTGTGQADTLLGDGGANLLIGGAGNDTLSGRGGEDTLVGGLGDDSLDGGQGNDTASYADVLAAVQVALKAGPQNTGGAGIDTLVSIESLIGSRFGDTLTGDGGANTLDGSAGSDTLTGGQGDDTYRVDSVGDVVIEKVGGGRDTVETTLRAYTLGANVENLTFIGLGAIAGTGNALGNVITGGASNDTLDGAGGADTLVGGAGNDTYYVDAPGDVVVEAVGQGGADVVFASTTWTASPGAAIERLVAVGTGPVALSGNAFAMEIDGNGAINVLSDGGGRDTLVGGRGNDVYVIANAATVVTELAGGGYDGVRTTLNAYTLAANVETLAFTGAGAFHGTGNALANLITGGDGADTLEGGGGTDRLVGGKGDDTYVVGSAGVAVVELAGAGEGRDTVQTTLSTYGAPANVEVVQFTGSGAFIGFANATGVSILGGGAADSLVGGVAADTLVGGAGSDRLTGGGGADVFALNAPGSGVDRLVDFAHGIDHLRVDAAIYGLAGLGDVVVVNGSSAPAGHSAFVYDAAGRLFWDATGGDPAHQTLIATLDGHPALSASDFLLG